MVTAEKLGKTLMVMVAERPDDVDGVIDTFLSFMKDRNLIYMAPAVLRYLKMQEKRRAAGEEVAIETAHDVSREILETVREEIAKKDTEMSHSTDESLIGGFRVRHNNVLYDATLQRNLERLRRELIT